MVGCTLSHSSSFGGGLVQAFLIFLNKVTPVPSIG
jgi:hypothetical protein